MPEIDMTLLEINKRNKNGRTYYSLKGEIKDFFPHIPGEFSTMPLAKTDIVIPEEFHLADAKMAQVIYDKMKEAKELREFVFDGTNVQALDVFTHHQVMRIYQITDTECAALIPANLGTVLVIKGDTVSADEAWNLYVRHPGGQCIKHFPYSGEMAEVLAEYKRRNPDYEPELPPIHATEPVEVPQFFEEIKKPEEE